MVIRDFGVFDKFRCIKRIGYALIKPESERASERAIEKERKKVKSATHNCRAKQCDSE